MTPRADKTTFSNRNLLLGLVGALALIVVLGTVLARQLLIFSPEDLVFQTETAYTLDADAADSLAVFTTEADVGADVDGHLLVAAFERAQIDGDIRESLTAFGGAVTLNGDVRGDALLVGAEVVINGGVTGDTVVFGESFRLEGETSGAITACADSITVPDGVTLRPCDRAAAQTILNRAGTRLAGVWLAARLANGPSLTDFGPALPLPPGLLLAGLGALAVVVFPRQVGRLRWRSERAPAV